MAFASTPHLQYGGVAAAWFTFPAGAVVQWVQPVRATLEHAKWLVGPAYEQLEARFPKHRGLTLVLDLAEMPSRTHAARSTFLGKARECSDRFARGLIVLPRRASSAHLHGVRAALALVRAMGVQVEVADTVAHAIAIADLRVAP